MKPIATGSRYFFTLVFLVIMHVLSSEGHAVERSPTDDLVQLCFKQELPKTTKELKEYAEACNTFSTAVKSIFESMQTNERSLKERKQEGLRGQWGSISLSILIIVNVILLGGGIFLAIHAYKKTDIADVLKEPTNGKWSYSRIVGLYGGGFAIVLFLFFFDVSFAHLFYFGTMPEQFGLSVSALAALLTTQLPYVFNRIAAKDQ